MYLLASPEVHSYSSSVTPALAIENIILDHILSIELYLDLSSLSFRTCH